MTVGISSARIFKQRRPSAVEIGRGKSMFAHLGRDRHGASAIEFAFIAPMFMGLLIGIVDFAHVFMIQSEMNAVAGQAVRRLALNSATVGQAKTMVQDRMSEITPGAVTVAVETTDLGEGLSDYTVAIDVPLCDVLIFGIKPLCGDGGGGSSGASKDGDAAMTSDADISDDGGGGGGGSGSGSGAIKGRMLSASATMLRE